MDRKVIIGIGIGCAVLCTVSIIIAVVAGGAFISWGLKEPENVLINVYTPLQATPNESVMIEVYVENTAAEVQSLDSIDISSSYLDGIAIVEAVPPYFESYDIPLVDMQSFTFDQSIRPGSTLVVNFFGVGVKTGDFSGNIDVCINSGEICSTFTTRTLIGE